MKDIFRIQGELLIRHHRAEDGDWRHEVLTVDGDWRTFHTMDVRRGDEAVLVK